MGMDVFGIKPTNEAGRYFRNNVWYWRPLAHLCNALAPEICAACEGWQHNGGDGLDAAGAEALALVLKRKLSDGTVARYVEERDRRLRALPDDPCEICDGTGARSDEIAIKHGHPERVITEAGHPRCGQKGWCNACDGRATVRPFETNYPCTVENVQEFAQFLEACGGFEIH